MFLFYDDEQAWSDAGEEAHEAAIKDAKSQTHRLEASGQYLCAATLFPSSTATSIQIRNGKRIVVNGPFAETREVRFTHRAYAPCLCSKRVGTFFRRARP